MDAHAWINTALVALSLAVTLFLASRGNMKSHERELAEIKVKVETMWGAFLASGVVKGIAKGVVEMNSPVRVIGNGTDLMEELRAPLEIFRREECPDCGEKELAMKIAAKFKEEIIKLCAPHEWQFELGVVLATAVAMGSKTLDHILDEYEEPKPPRNKVLTAPLVVGKL